MKTERSIKELLIILRNNLVKEIKSDPNIGGMCAVAYSLIDSELILSYEKDLIINYLEENIPQFAIERKMKFCDMYDKDGFSLARHWFKPRVIKPRLEWLNQQIKKL